LNLQLDLLPPLMSRRVPNLNVTITPPVTEIGEAIDTSRGQYHSTRIIAILESQSSLATFEKILGVTSLDLFNPSPMADGGGYVYGEARLRGRSGIVSTFRLRAASSGLQSGVRFADRIRKEVIHELGHMVGLEHCSSQNCAMYKSEGVEDVDSKSDGYCEQCESILKELRR